jgi:4-amino-4-deoxy-L-arabinose transferase-like glycosyltransferase
LKLSIKNIWPVLIIAIFNVALHLSVLNNLEYHRDEMLYFSLGQHPDFGYNSVPPMIGWLAWILQNVFGFSLFAVRIIPALMSGVLIILTARMTKELGGSDYAQILAAVGMTVTGFGLRSFGLFMPVHIDLFFWTLCLFMIIRFINSKEDKYLIFFGITAGLSLLNKYLIGCRIYCNCSLHLL